MTALSARFDIYGLAGLSPKEAAERLRAAGYNELPAARRRSSFLIAFDVATEPMFLLLVACGTVYLLLGHWHDALMLLGFVFVVMGITLYQQRKTERALEALRDLSSPRAMVIRDRQQVRIPGREVVRDDLVVVAEGDRVPADGAVLWCMNLLVNESLLTGESAPAIKTTWDGATEMARPGGDGLPFVYSGTLVVKGQAVVRVLATGPRTEMGKIGKAIERVETEKTPLQRATARLVRSLAIVGLSLCVVMAIVYGVMKADWLRGILSGISLAMAVLPEEFPVVMAIFLALGAWRMAQQQVLTRRLPALETLGAATVLAVDKTGTITFNRMSVTKLFARGRFFDVGGQQAGTLPEAFHEIVEFSILASQKDPFDPMEKALRQLGELHLAQTEHLHRNWELVHEYPLSPELLALSHVWKSPDGDQYVIAAKGAPEAIGDLCHLNERLSKSLTAHVSAMAADGLRVLGVAKSRFRAGALPGEQHSFEFHFLGLVGLADPVRPTVPAAVEECYAAGMRVVMITGDHPETARQVAREIGLKPADTVITGSELEAMDDDELQRRIRTVSIFARVLPEQKLRLVDALKANGETVGMTGDGVNDAPALKAAHIGIAMGARGTDVAREASALVLLDDDFSSIVRAVKMGRRIFDNLKKAMAYIFAIHVPIAGLSLVPLLFGAALKELVLMPVHIVFLELIIDPACSVAFEAEPEEADVMSRPPRDPREPLFGRRAVGVSLLQGMSVLLIAVALLAVALRLGRGEDEARALAFTTLVVANLGLILTNRSWSRTVIGTLRSRNRALWLVFAGALAFLGLVLYVPVLRGMFHFAPLHLDDLAICLGAGVISVLWFEVLKIINGAARTGPPPAAGARGLKESNGPQDGSGN